MKLKLQMRECVSLMVTVPGGAASITESKIHSEWVLVSGGAIYIFSEGVLHYQIIKQQRRIWWSLRGCICFECVKFSQGYLCNGTVSKVFMILGVMPRVLLVSTAVGA